MLDHAQLIHHYWILKFINTANIVVHKLHALWVIRVKLYLIKLHFRSDIIKVEMLFKNSNRTYSKCMNVNRSAHVCPQQCKFLTD